MIKRIKALGFKMMLASVLPISIIGCNEKNSSYSVPPMVAYLTSESWKIDSVIYRNNNDTIRAARANGFANSSIQFIIGTAQAQYVFRDLTDAAMLGPSSLDVPGGKGDSALFRYSKGLWSFNKANDTIIHVPEDGYAQKWRIVDTSRALLVVSYADTLSVPMTINGVSTSVIYKKVFFSRRN